MFNGKLVARNHITKEEAKITRGFHCLKVVKSNEGNYKLKFCNILGNEFFEYKKHDPQHFNALDEYKLVDFSSAKKTYSLKFKERVSHAPKFFTAERAVEPKY
ncbi:hypothetical protein [Wolbachia endosymbiont of Litomosoides brasiliensis]|uniref:hypothetical protein n=1 Tax=Wolbachia endosymbiont of Litomosoides brasiliensis TaxID=1812117 RepID=UPI001FE6F69F|nr:hypothetical protein [Wolbachia endosymbiont of Litomosoides brasiliensis]